MFLPLSHHISLSAMSLFQSFLLRHHAKPKTMAYTTKIQLSATESIFYSKLYRLPVEILPQTSVILQHSNKDLPAFIMQILLQLTKQ